MTKGTLAAIAVGFALGITMCQLAKKTTADAPEVASKMFPVSELDKANALLHNNPTAAGKESK